MPQSLEVRGLQNRVRKLCIKACPEIFVRGVGSVWEPVVLYVSRKVFAALTTEDRTRLKESSTMPVWFTKQFVSDALAAAHTAGDVAAELQASLHSAPVAAPAPHVVHALTKQRRGDRGCDVFLSANAPMIRDVAAKLVLDGDASTRGRTAARVRRMVGWRLWKSLLPSDQAQYVEAARRPRMMARAAKGCFTTREFEDGMPLLDLVGRRQPPAEAAATRTPTKKRLRSSQQFSAVGAAFLEHACRVANVSPAKASRGKAHQLRTLCQQVLDSTGLDPRSAVAQLSPKIKSAVGGKKVGVSGSGWRKTRVPDSKLIHLLDEHLQSSSQWSKLHP